MSPWVEDVTDFTAVAQAKDLDPLAWAIRVSSIVGPAGVELPSPEIAELLVRHAFSTGSRSPTSWKYLEKAISSNLAPPALVIALLSIRVIPKRHAKPAAYRLYMEILRRHLFTFSSDTLRSNYSRVFTLIYDILGLSQIVLTCDPGVIIVEFVLCIIWQLLDAALVDEGLMHWYLDKRPKWLGTSCAMETDTDNGDEKHIVEYSDKLPQSNTVMSIELIAQCLRDARISRLLILARRHMQLNWESFSFCLRLLAEKSSALRISRISPDTFLHFFSDNSSRTCKKILPVRHNEFCAISSGLPSTDGHAYGSNHSSLWIPLDFFLEDAINGSIAATNSTEVLYDLVKALQALNKISWNDTFLNLWLAALRLVQRERDLTERPQPDTDIRMSILLSVVTLTVADLIEDEIVSTKSSSINIKEKNLASDRAEALVSCLQMLGEYEALLAPPISVVSAANQAAGKASMILSGISPGSSYLDISVDDKTILCTGNLRHLIVEACIARNLLDTSAYYWPGYVNGEMSSIPQSIPSQISWSALVQGAPLTSLMSSTLVNTPAPSLPDLEKVFEIAISGLPDERIRAASVLCGASLIRGWNFQEHTVFFVVRLLSPSVPVDYSDSKSHLINHAPLLNIVLTGISSMDCVHIFSLYGLVPELAGSLMPICEAFGSCSPDISLTLPTGEAITVYTVFSNAFVLLLRLWKFNHSPLEYCFLGENAPLGSKLNPDYLLFLRNLDVLSFGNIYHKKINRGRLILTGVNSQNSIVLDSFPKLKVWYQQHQACLASPLSGLLSGTPVHKNVDCLLNIMFTRINGGGSHYVESATTGSSSVSSSSAQPRDDGSFKPKLTAWDIMEAVPFVVDASLTACSCGKLSPREFVTGLKYLTDFLPASLGAIVSYFTAEVTRGVWKPAFMNGTDWPSPAANLATVEEHIKKILAATGVDVPRVKTGNSPAMLPLPLAAFLSLTITYNLDKSSELNLVGPALENLATSCPWPSMPIVSALWAQKVKRWSYYLTFSASGTVFYHNNNAAVQLLKSCFSAVLGLSDLSIYSGGGVWSLLGNGFDPNVTSGLSPVAPGLLYLEVHRKVRDISLLSGEILSTLMSSVRELASDSLSKDARKTKKNPKYETRYGQVSLFSVLTKAKPAASLGAILIWLSGGSGLIQGLFHELLPSWFLSAQRSDRGSTGSTVAMLEGYTLAYFAVLCGMFAWGIDSSRSSKRRPKIIGAHLKFLADALDGKVVLGCSWATYKVYVTEFLGLLVECAPIWVAELELGLLKKICLGLKMWNENELAIRILERAGTPAIGAAAEFIINSK